MSSYVTNSGRPVTPEMGAFLRLIENGCCILLADSSQDGLAAFTACAGIGINRTLHYIEELRSQYIEKSQRPADGKPLDAPCYVLTLKARAFLVDNNLDW